MKTGKPRVFQHHEIHLRKLKLRETKSISLCHANIDAFLAEDGYDASTSLIPRIRYSHCEPGTNSLRYGWYCFENHMVNHVFEESGDTKTTSMRPNSNTVAKRIPSTLKADSDIRATTLITIFPSI